MSQSNSSTSGGIFLPLLAILFIGLKLTGNIDWSWWWVLAPIWMPLALAAIVITIIAIGVAVRRAQVRR